MPFFLGSWGSLSSAQTKDLESFFECFPNHYVKDFVGMVKNSTIQIYSKFDTFFSPPEICGKMSQIVFSMKSVEIFFDYFSMKSAVEIFFDFFSMKSSVQMFFEFFQ